MCCGLGCEKAKPRKVRSEEELWGSKPFFPKRRQRERKSTVFFRCKIVATIDVDLRSNIDSQEGDVARG